MKSLAMLGVAALLIGLATLGVACGGGGGGKLTLEQYFQKLDEIQNDTDATFATQEASTGEPSQDDSGEELAAFLRDNVTSSADILRGAAADVDDLEPPDEVADAHNDLVVATNDTVDALDGIADSLPDTLTFAELENVGTTLFNSAELSASDEQFVAACAALQAIADDNGIDVDLECEE